MTQPAGWYQLSSNDPSIHYWDGEQLTGHSETRSADASYPILDKFTEQNVNNPFGNFVNPNPSFNTTPNKPVVQQKKSLSTNQRAGIGCLGLILCALIFVGCTAIFVGASNSSNNNTNDYSSESLPEDAKNSLFVSLMKSKYPEYFAQYSDEQIISKGQDFCNRLDTGEDLLVLSLELTMDEKAEIIEPEAYLLGSAVATYCPQYKEELEALAG